MENKIKIETKPEDRKVMPKYVYVCLAILVVIIGIVYYNANLGKMYMYSTDFNEDGYAGVGFHCVVNVNSDTDWAIDMGPDGNNPSILVKKIDCENAKLYYESENRMDVVKVYEGYEARVRRSGFRITDPKEVELFMGRVGIYGPTMGYVPVMVGIESEEESGD